VKRESSEYCALVVGFAISALLMLTFCVKGSGWDPAKCVDCHKRLATHCDGCVSEYAKDAAAAWDEVDRLKSVLCKVRSGAPQYDCEGYSDDDLMMGRPYVPADAWEITTR